MSRYLLAQAVQPSLREFLAQRPLLAFDFDGTLAPIVRDPAAARVPARTRSLLAEVAELYPCAVVSGRARRDVRDRVAGVRLVSIVGNHGAEAGARPAVPRRDVVRWKRRLETALEGEAGVWIEDKRYSLSIHYRNAPSRARAARVIGVALSELPEIRVVSGKCVVNVVARSARDKGLAVLALRAQSRAPCVLYVGDDVTDEDAFRLASPRFWAVRVGRSKSTAAPFHLVNQREIVNLLRFCKSNRPSSERGSRTRPNRVRLEEVRSVPGSPWSPYQQVV